MSTLVYHRHRVRARWFSAVLRVVVSGAGVLQPVDGAGHLQITENGSKTKGKIIESLVAIVFCVVKRAI